MLTPAMRASRTSEPPVIIAKAVSTQVLLPPFLNLLPLFEETTTGLTLLGVIIVGACPKRVAGMAAAGGVGTIGRRFSFFTAPAGVGGSGSDLDFRVFHSQDGKN